jgi:hypothetical protein
MNESKNDIFPGQWVVRYDRGALDFRAVMTALPGLQRRAGGDMAGPRRGFITFNADGTTTIAADFPVDLSRFDGGDNKKIKAVHLAYPALLSDKRWETIHLTSASLFIGSALRNAGYDVTADKQILPAASVDARVRSRDLLGLTLFEDLFFQVRDFLAGLRGNYNGLVAVGGPMVTLTPLQTACHLPGIHLLVRGEAEFVLPGLLDAVNANDLEAMLQFDGFLFHLPGIIIISNFDKINRPGDFKDFRFNLDFLEKKHMEQGLEINVSRGCKRGCVFCSAVQGRKLRKLPVEHFENLLEQFAAKVKASDIQAPRDRFCRTVNINDDDILQDRQYARQIFQVIKKRGFRLWGVQTSINSLFHSSGEVDMDAMAVIDDRALYMDDNPLVWCGTDAFLAGRGKRLGKTIPAENRVVELVQEFEKRGIRNYHYWISSDWRTDWREFVQEFRFIYRLWEGFDHFGLIAHSPFLVPYSSTPVYRLLNRSDELREQVKYRGILEAGERALVFPLAERVETPYRHLNRLLSNEKLDNRPGFFDYLNRKDPVNGFITLYNFLKLERLDAESLGRMEMAASLKHIENELEEFIARIL